MAADDPVQHDAFTMFSFEDILREATLKKKQSRANSASWERLITVAKELAGSPRPDAELLPDNTVWNIESVSIHRYRGIGNTDPLAITFEPTPGITVLHGLNGAGKSSVSDAIDVALSGKSAGKSGTKTGQAPLWDPIPLSRGSASADISVSLAGGNSRLRLDASLDASGAVHNHTATILDGNAERTIEISDSWHGALLSHQPVFAYASLERRVQLSRDLAEYFEGLLALGGSFVALQELIASKSAESKASLSQWKLSKDGAMRAILAVDEQYSEQASQPLDSIGEPKINEGIDEWLKSFDLTHNGEQSPSLKDDTFAQLGEAAEQAIKAIHQFELARTTSELQLSTALKSLHSEASGLSVESTTCPVCKSDAPDWFKTLGETVQRNQGVDKLRRAVADDTHSLAEAATALLDPAISVFGEDSEDEPLFTFLAEGQGLLKTFRTIRRSRTDSEFEVMSATNALAKWIVSDNADRLVSEALARTDVIKQWKIARSRAVADFIVVWTSQGRSAAEANLWSQTSTRLEDLRKHLRSQRSDALEKRASIRIERLLADANLRLRSLDVLNTKASMELVDEHDEVVSLGMLSAGQRNAVLLAPLLASIDSGPFGFLILDDPVHAFDELRIDRLAETLMELAETRRVIVLTHDERLKEHLMSRASSYDTRLVNRESTTGIVNVSDSSHFWDELLTDARSILDLAVDTSGTAEDVTDSVRSLCRMAIDNALRTFTLRNATLNGRESLADVEVLDSCPTTKERLKAAESFWVLPSGQNPVTQAIQKCHPHFESWNKSIHGNPAIGIATADEIRNAREACKKLARAI